jgi:pyrimidine deaminase RibD-like protein
MQVWLVTANPTCACNLRGEAIPCIIKILTTDVKKIPVKTERQNAIRLTGIFAIKFHLP